MEGAIHRFIRLLRLHGVRVSTAEAVDAMHAAAQPGVLAEREILKAALSVTLIKDRRDLEAFDRVFDRFFFLRPVIEEDAGHGHSHAHDDLSDQGELEKFSLSDEPGDEPQLGHSHGKPQDLREFFDAADMAQQYNLHQEANRLDMASMTDEIVLSNESKSGAGEAARVQISTSRLHNSGAPKGLTDKPGLQLDTELSVAEEIALLEWLADVDPEADQGDDAGIPPSLAALREMLAPFLAELPERLREHLEKLMAMDAEVEGKEIQTGRAQTIAEQERADLEESIRRLLKSLQGAPRARRGVSSRGTVDGRRTMRANMRYDGVPFRPVTVRKVEDKPRLVILADVSLSVRAAARFTMHMVHSLQSMTSQVRTFAFVSDLVEITDLFAEHRIEDALSLVLSGLPAGGMLDVDADSNYGEAFDQFLDGYGSALTRRTSLIILGDGRGNGNDPRTRVFEEMSRRARRTVWLTPEPRYSWGLGRCDLPLYEEYCDRIEVVRSMRGLESLVTGMAEPVLR